MKSEDVVCGTLTSMMARSFDASTDWVSFVEDRKHYEQRHRPQLKVIHLIEKFYHQVRYGCTASQCGTASCRTYQEQKSKDVPYRVPSTTTARAIAAYLAASDNPEACLCTNAPAPKPNPFDLAFPTSRALYTLHDYPGEGLNVQSSMLKQVLLQTTAHADWFAKSEIEQWMQNQALAQICVDPKQRIEYPANESVDTKSFAQRFFTSMEWRLLQLYQYDPCLDNSFARSLQHHWQRIDTSKSPVEAIYDELNNITSETRAKSFFMGGEVNYTLFEDAYHDKNFLSRSEPREDLDLQYRNVTTKDMDVAEYLNVFATPSKLMFHGLYPFPRQPCDTTDSRSCHNAQHNEPGLEFFRSRYSQSHVVLYLEMLTIQHDNLTSKDVLRWVSSSVKETHLASHRSLQMPSPIAAHIIAVALACLSVTVFNSKKLYTPRAWDLFEALRKKGYITFDAWNRPRHAASRKQANLVDRWGLAYEEPAAQDLMRLILRSFASWSYASTQFITTKQSQSGIARVLHDHGSDFKARLLMFLSDTPVVAKLNNLLTYGVLEWARTIFLRNWDGNYRFAWNTDVGASIEFLRWMYAHREKLNIHPEQFMILVLIDRVDYVEACKDWIGFVPTESVGHLFDYAWLFPNTAKVTIFRAVNLCRMFAAYEDSINAANLVERVTSHVKASARQLLNRLSVSTERILVLEIRRDNILRDAFNQLWRRQKRELFRPLKVRMGMEEGEEGVDMGGVQQEFFRLAIADALMPDNGLFMVDEKTRMTWFQPMSPAPLYQFTLIGLLFGLAIYNGITLTVTFPLAFYRKLLGSKNTGLGTIKDGWPDLHAGLDKLVKWTEGPVEEVFLRTYTFSFEAFGQVHDVDMWKTKRDDSWSLPGPDIADTDAPLENPLEEETCPNILQSQTETHMVDNDNRKVYVEDYVFWLTEKSVAPQFQAFADGFYLPLQKKALHLFSPENLQSLIEGHETIDVEGLQRAATYEDGFYVAHPRIIEFWEIVRDFNAQQHKQLLEFVTASPRVPVRGMSEVTFIIQRNGVGDERLPSSMTCFGRLLLPEYSSKVVMAEKLRVAIENSIGFGTQ